MRAAEGARLRTASMTRGSGRSATARTPTIPLAAGVSIMIHAKYHAVTLTPQPLLAELDRAASQACVVVPELPVNKTRIARPEPCQTGNTCAPWQTAYMSLGEACTYSNQCQSGLECMDNGLGEASCGYSSSNNARVCQPGWAGACGTDPNYSSCGYPRGSSSETGVCGGSGASCSGESHVGAHQRLADCIADMYVLPT